MKTWYKGTIFHLILSCAVALSTLTASPGYSAYHDPSTVATTEFDHLGVRAAPNEAQGVSHSHSHDDGWAAERQDSDHSHKHNPTDHSHDIPAAADMASDTRPEVGHLWLSHAPSNPPRDPSFGIERPPRP